MSSSRARIMMGVPWVSSAEILFPIADRVITTRADNRALLSGGSIALLNWASAIAVTVAMVILFAEFLETYYVPLEHEDVAS